ncbi:ATP-binding cassette domain-containing protein [Arenibacter sp. BSSL-BM3]|uniref:ATP-binding cassette domain-containing protein n=1 Tax=Arenibacter arenosicollis TaxID=2762274 RepID=A0ABR7QIH2_9FLAO|nr:ATP-binding cassette domain-containing protein [Arenibacter arenosicollis]MBC8766996.1 ATP-binding cassette domain-containing protein [Arenibacter arenosicollis]
MNRKIHWAVFINNNSQKDKFIKKLLEGPLPEGFEGLKDLKGALFSKTSLNEYIDEEERHGIKIINQNAQQSLKSMSSGEQKKALLKYIFHLKPDFIVLDNPFDNLDKDSQKDLKASLNLISKSAFIIQLISRKADLLPFITHRMILDKSTIKPISNGLTEVKKGTTSLNSSFSGRIPRPIIPTDYEESVLIDCRDISVAYGDKNILNNINWTIRKGEFWQLIGQNGSGKSTLLSMITGDNHKGYGQELYLFGQQKGTGESVWDIKKRIGYYTPSMTDKFSGLHSALNMVISGMNDSVGLYLLATENQRALAKEWLLILDMWHLRDVYFADLSTGQQRMIMTARAMIKHPPLLILDEPTAGLDDESAMLFISLVNKIARESKTAIVFVSHRKEPGLEPKYIYELKMSPEGSIGKMI